MHTRRMLTKLLGNHEPDPGTVGRAVAGLRVLAGLLWLYNVSWKLPPDFGRDREALLYGYVVDAIEHPVFPPFSWAMENIVEPMFIPFGWGVLVAETALAVLLLTGTLTRPAALLGVAQSAAIGLSVLMTPGEWPWSYYLMVGVHVVLFFAAAGHTWGADGVRAAADPGRAARVFVGAWGAILAGLGVVVAVIALFAGTVRLAPGGYELSLGEYNLAGAIVLAVVGGLLFAASRTGAPRLAMAAAGLAAVAAASIYVQVTAGSSVWLGANLTTAALLLTGAVAGLPARRFAAAGARERVAVG